MEFEGCDVEYPVSRVSKRAWTMIAAALLLFVGEAGLDAQGRTDRELPRGSVSGIILDAETSAPLGGATVVVEPAPTGVLPGSVGSGQGFLPASRGVLTDSAGRYRFEDLAPGRYRLLVSRAGYRSASFGVELRGSADSRVSVGLTVEPVALQAVEVVADRAQHFGRDRSLDEVEGGSRVAAVRARQRRHLASDARELTHADVVESVTLGETDLFRALQRLPGVTTRDDFTAELWTRGATWDQTRVLFDGLPLYHPLHGMGLFAAVSPDAVGGAVLHPGVRPSSLGPGAAGVLDIASRRGGGSGEVRGTADLSLASVRLAADQRVLDGRAAWMISGRRTYLDWISGAMSRLVDDPEAYVPYRFSDLTTRFDLQLAPGRALEASGLFERDYVSGDVPDVLHGNSASWGNSAARISYVAPLAGLSARHTLGVSRYGAAVRSRQPEFDEEYNAPTERPGDNTLFHLAARGEVTGQDAPEGGNPWRLGYELVRQQARYDGPPPRLYVGTQPSDSTPISRRSALTYGSLWGERRWEVGDALSVEVGLRLDAGQGIAERGVVRLAPGVVARHRLSTDLTVSAGVGRSHQYTQALAPTGPSFHRNFSASQLWLLADGETPAIRSDIATLGGEAWLGAGWLAAVLLLLAAPLMLVRPLRAWVADRLSAGWDRVATWAEGAPARDAPQAPAAEAGSRILFTVAGPVFVVEVAVPQSVGQLWIRASGSDQGLLSVSQGSDESPIILEQGVRLVNGPGSSASYELALPRSVERVRVQVAGRLAATFSSGELQQGVSVPLTGSAAR